ncbi:MAG: ROK family protein [Bacteroidales bacterium]|jgi:glucokinase|nr:ROK family protein [Bacteroidales bacterium]
MIVLTLDAGGTNFVFSAIRNNKIISNKICRPSYGNNLENCLNSIIVGFKELQKEVGEKADAISFAFPGPADYKDGIIGDLYNLPAFKGGVALGPMLENIFNIPVFINNDGDLYAYGEALAGTLPAINKRLEDNQNKKQYKNLIGLTIGTGFGAGLISDGILIKGDNICAAEIWITSNRIDPGINSEEGVSIRAARHFYADYAKIPFADTPEPKDIFEIGMGKQKGNTKAAKMAYEKMGHFIGDTIANMITLFDGIVVIGGGVAGAKELIIPGIQKELNNGFKKLNGEQNPRLIQKTFCLNEKSEYEDFLKIRGKKIKIPFSDKEILYDIEPRSAYIFSDFNTSDMINLGAYNYAVEQLKNNN